MNELQKAEIYLNKAISLDPHFIVAILSLAEIQTLVSDENTFGNLFSSRQLCLQLKDIPEENNAPDGFAKVLKIELHVLKIHCFVA